MADQAARILADRKGFAARLVQLETDAATDAKNRQAAIVKAAKKFEAAKASLNEATAEYRRLIAARYGENHAYERQRFEIEAALIATAHPEIWLFIEEVKQRRDDAHKVIVCPPPTIEKRWLVGKVQCGVSAIASRRFQGWWHTRFLERLGACSPGGSCRVAPVIRRGAQAGGCPGRRDGP